MQKPALKNAKKDESARLGGGVRFLFIMEVFLIGNVCAMKSLHI